MDAHIIAQFVVNLDQASHAQHLRVTAHTPKRARTQQREKKKHDGCSIILTLFRVNMKERG